MRRILIIALVFVNQSFLKTFTVIWIGRKHPRPPPPAPPSGQRMKKQSTKEKRQYSVDSKVSIRLAQNIFIDNIQDVSKTLVTSDHDQGIKIRSMSLRNFVRAILRGLVLCGDFLKSLDYQLFK